MTPNPSIERTMSETLPSWHDGTAKHAMTASWRAWAAKDGLSLLRHRHSSLDPLFTRWVNIELERN